MHCGGSADDFGGPVPAGVVHEPDPRAPSAALAPYLNAEVWLNSSATA